MASCGITLFASVRKDLAFMTRSISSVRPCTATSARFFYTTQALRKTEDNSLLGKVALISGLRGGIGEGIAHALASKGCKIIVTTEGSRDDDVQSIMNQFQEEFDSEPLHISADLSQKSDIERLCNEIYKIHPEGVDILVNNSGLHQECPLLELPDDQWQEMISVLLSAPYYLSHMLRDSMKRKRWGRIINVSSAHGTITAVPPKRTAYGLVKSSLVGLSKVAATEMSPYGVTCNTLCLGYVNTSTFQGQVRALQEELKCSYDEAKHHFVGKRDITKSLVEIPNLAQTVAFLCSDASAHITGASLHIDGGMRF